MRLIHSYRQKLLALCTLVLLCYALANHVGEQLMPLIDKAGYEALKEQNETYLKEAGTEALSTFLVMSALKSGLAVMQSSQAGISFIIDVQVQVGRLIDSVVSIVDYGWSGSLLSLGTIEFLHLLIDSSEKLTLIGLHVLLAALILHQVFVLIRGRVAGWIDEAVRVSFMLTAATMIVIPAAIHLASEASAAITADGKRAAVEEIQSKHKDILSHNGKNSIRKQAEHGAERFSETSEGLSSKRSHLTEQVTRHLTATLFDVFVFPLFFLGTLLYLLRKLAARFTVVLAWGGRVEKEVDESLQMVMSLSERPAS